MPVGRYAEQPYSSAYNSEYNQSSYDEADVPLTSGRSSRRAQSEPREVQDTRTPEEIATAAKQAVTDILVRQGPDAIGRTLGQGSTFDRICHVVGKVLAELGKLAFLAGLGAFILSGAGLLALIEVPLQLVIGGGISLLAGEIIKNMATKPAADLTMNHTFSI